jgi:hypothetical protein
VRLDAFFGILMHTGDTIFGYFGWTDATGCALATGSPDSVSCMLCGVIFGWAKCPGLPTVTSCEMKTRALVQFLPAGRKRLFSAAFGPWTSRMQRSSDRVLTAGADVAGRYAAPRAGPERQPGAAGVGPCRSLGMDPHQLPPQSARRPERSQVPQAAARTRPALAVSLQEVLAGR